MTEGPEGHLYCQKYTKIHRIHAQLKFKKRKKTNTNNGAVQEYKKQTIIKYIIDSPLLCPQLHRSCKFGEISTSGFVR